MKKTFTFLAVALIVELAAVTYLEYKNGRGAFRRQTVTDTVRLTVVDTVKVRLPVAKDSTVIRYLTVRVTKKDTARGQIRMIGKDTVRLPVEQKRYTDDSTYTAYISGYRPRLDSIEVYPRRETVVVTRTQSLTPKAAASKPSRLTFGLQAGYGLTPKGFQPYIGIGAGWRLF